MYRNITISEMINFSTSSGIIPWNICVNKVGRLINLYYLKCINVQALVSQLRGVCAKSLLAVGALKSSLPLVYNSHVSADSALVTKELRTLLALELLPVGIVDAQMGEQFGACYLRYTTVLTNVRFLLCMSLQMLTQSIFSAIPAITLFTEQFQFLVGHCCGGSS